MNADFSRILVLLRKEKGFSQKNAANGLEISQALLSHYEKGVRECGLDFLVKVANYYSVSCDYLLGRSPERTGAVIMVEDIPEPDSMGKENQKIGSILPTLNKKLIANSLNVLFGLLAKAEHKELTTEVSAYLTLAIYKMYRYIYSAEEKNPQGAFAVDKAMFSDLSTATMTICEMQIKCIANGVSCNNISPLEDISNLTLTPEKIAAQYPLFASSLSNLIQNAEAKMGIKKVNK
jgi:transcriptional regulator with XRE-family HTH domain